MYKIIPIGDPASAEDVSEIFFLREKSRTMVWPPDTWRHVREFNFYQTLWLLSGARRLIPLVSSLHDSIPMFHLTTVGLSG